MIRPVAAADRSGAIASLVAAFADDPAMCFMFPDARQRRRHLPRLFAMLYDSDSDNGLRLISDDRQAVTLWRAPGSAGNDARFGWRQRLLAMWRFGEGLKRAHRLGQAIEAHFPPQPFWYLHIAGCAPAVQGRGLGAAAVRAGLHRIEGVPAYLETANEANLGFYRHLGFEVHSRWQVPGDGPVFWSMQRG